MNNGLVYIFTGEGKGKTSAAIGTAIRAAGAGLKVAWVAFYKQTSWKGGEMAIFEKLGIEIYLFGKGFYLGNDKVQKSNVKLKTAALTAGAKAVDWATPLEHKAAAEKTLELARQLVGKVDVLVLDEVNNAIKDGLIDVGEVVKVVEGRRSTHMILTGRNANVELIGLADLVTEMKKVKHPYDMGKLAVRGLDF